MLLNFSIENFASIGIKQTINLINGKARGKNEHLIKCYNKNILKFSSIYGANASGKTTMIKAMNFGKKVIGNGYFDKRYMSTNRSNDTWLEKPTEFIYTVFIDNKIYEYGFSLLWSMQRIIKEWLIEQNSRDIRQTIFLRDFISNDFNITIKYKSVEQQNRIQMYFNDASKETNKLFLNDINSGKGNLFTDYPSLQYLQSIYRWFVTKLKFVYPNNDATDLGAYSFLNHFDNNVDIIKYLDELGIPITNMKYIDISKEKAFKDIEYEVIQKVEEDIIKTHRKLGNNDTASIIMRTNEEYFIIEVNSEGFQNIKTVEFTHSEYGTYEYKEESDGTRRLLELLEILTSPEDGITYIVDELDRSLHPLLTEQFILKYLELDKQKNRQLIITTHESRLLNLNHLRKDEIYFSTNKKGESEFVRLDEYENGNARADVNIEVAYLRGRYNAIPNFIK